MNAVEASAITAAAAAPIEGRYSMYHAIHKALRLAMSETLTRIGRTDPADAAEVDATLAQVRGLLDLCALHLHDENTFVHPAIEAAEPGAAARIAAEHVEHQESIDGLRDLAGLVDDTARPARAAALQRLYSAAAVFVGENFEHMHFEETRHNAVLWAHYSDAELHDIEAQLVASIPPQAMMAALHWFLPALNAPERAGMLGGMRQGMPAPAFEAVLGIAAQRLGAADAAKLAGALGLPALA